MNERINHDGQIHCAKENCFLQVQAFLHPRWDFPKLYAPPKIQCHPNTKAELAKPMVGHKAKIGKVGNSNSN